MSLCCYKSYFTGFHTLKQLFMTQVRIKKRNLRCVCNSVVHSVVKHIQALVIHCEPKVFAFTVIFILKDCLLMVFQIQLILEYFLNPCVCGHSFGVIYTGRPCSCPNHFLKWLISSQSLFKTTIW